MLYTIHPFGFKQNISDFHLHKILCFPPSGSRSQVSTPPKLWGFWMGVFLCSESPCGGHTFVGSALKLTLPESDKTTCKHKQSEAILMQKQIK